MERKTKPEREMERERTREMKRKREHEREIGKDRGQAEREVIPFRNIACDH